MNLFEFHIPDKDGYPQTIRVLGEDLTHALAKFQYKVCPRPFNSLQSLTIINKGPVK